MKNIDEEVNEIEQLFEDTGLKPLIEQCIKDGFKIGYNAALAEFKPIIDRLEKNLKEARREICELTYYEHPYENCREVAKARGWDCFDADIGGKE